MTVVRPGRLSAVSSLIRASSVSKATITRPPPAATPRARRASGVEVRPRNAVRSAAAVVGHAISTPKITVPSWSRLAITVTPQ
jgi:hypothetical protein